MLIFDIFTYILCIGLIFVCSYYAWFVFKHKEVPQIFGILCLIYDVVFIYAVIIESLMWFA